MKYLTRLLRTAALVILTVSLLPGCATLLPQTSALDKVHDLYRTEFLAAPPPAAQGSSALKGQITNSTNQAAFGRTLAAIQDYRQRHPNKPAELAHLQVLEGLIYLQSYRFNMAKLVSADVTEAAGKLTSAGGYTTRDKLLAENFTNLLNGWRASVGNASSNEIFLMVHSASNLVTQLAPYGTNNSAKVRYAADKDGGALYVANCAAIFFVRAYDDYVVGNRGVDDPPRKKDWYGSGARALGWFLTDQETNTNASNDFKSGSDGRLRYIQWYHFLRTASP